MNAGSMSFKGIVAVLVLGAGGIGCSHNGDHRMSRAERRSRSHSDRTRTATVAEAPPRTYADQPGAGQSYTNSSQAPVAPAAYQGSVVSATAANASSVSYSAPPVAAQDGIDATSSRDAAVERQDARVTVRAPEAPPPTRLETPTHSVSKGEFWVNGNWNWNSHTFIWQPGRMERLRANQLYHPATWTQSSQGWDFTPAYWQ